MLENLGSGYKPTAEELVAIRPLPDMLKVSGDGVFATLQGEGVTAGAPSVFMRLHYCNLTCGANGGWICDTLYTWLKESPEYWRESENWSYETTASNIEKAWKEKFGQEIPDDQKRVVITGGEPLLQQKKIVKLLEFLPDWKVEFETNGTIIPLPELSNHQFNCSPKLSNSGNTAERRYKPKALKTINEISNSWFKFVVSDPSDLKEIDFIVKDCNLKHEKVMIMPEGHNSETVNTHLEIVKDEVLKRGWSITKRNQLDWYGPKRRT